MAETAHKVDQGPEERLRSLRIQINEVDEGILGQLANYRASIEATIKNTKDVTPLLKEMVEVIRMGVFHLSDDLRIKFSNSKEQPISEIILPDSSETEEVIHLSMMAIRNRLTIALEVGKVKREMGREIYDKEREDNHIREIMKSAKERGLPIYKVRTLFRDIMTLCRKSQELDAFPEDTLKQLIKEAIDTYTKSNRNIKRLLLTAHGDVDNGIA